MAQASASDVTSSVLPKNTPATTGARPQTQPAEPLSPTAVQQDTALEYDSMVLLSKLEQLTIRLSDKMVHTSKTLALKYLIELANHIVEFAEQLSAAKAQKLSLTMLLTKDSQNYAFLRPQHVHNERLCLEDFVDSHQDVLRSPITFPELSKDILRVINIYLSIFVAAFSSPRMSEQWRTLYKGFFVTLTKTVRAIQGGEHA